jgi:hypothetical protein
VATTATASDEAGASESEADDPSAGAEPSFDGGTASIVLAALQSPTPIFARPERAPKDDGAKPDDSKVIRIGSLRKGQTVLAKPQPIRGTGCRERWFELEQGGFVCGRYVTSDLSQKELKEAPHAPFTDRPLPYDYGLNLTNGTPMYRRAPLRRERAEYEKGLAVGRSKSKDEDTAPAKEAVADKGQTPWYLRDHAREGVTFDDLKGESALVVLRMVRGFYVAIDQEVHAFAGRFWRTTRGNFVPRDHILVHQSKPDLEGVWVGHDDEPRKLPLGVGLRPTSRQYELAPPNNVPKARAEYPRFTIFGLSGQRVVSAPRAYEQTTEGWWMRDLDGVVIRAGTPPSGLAPGEKWIEVNLTAQTLVAYEGDKPVFATLVSSGRHNDEDKARDHRTPSGNFRIREKHISTTMDDDTATDGPYSIEDVPWVMYFEKSYALHGAFWHSSFGQERSHGCINLTPHDAKELFGWVGPKLPEGWHSVRATEQNAGTRVIVHE